MRKHGQQRAERFLLDLISHIADSGETVLPPVRALARSAEVSPLTMQRTIRTLKTRGLIAGTQRSRLRAVTGIAVPVPAAPEKPRLRPGAETRHRLAADILTGRFTHGSLLPSVKELCARYGTGYRAMIAALAQLGDTGLLIRDRRGYRAFQGHGTDTGSMIMITGGNEQGQLLRWTSRVDSMVQSFESECIQRRIRPVIVTYHIPSRSFFVGSGMRTTLGKVIGEPGMLGLCVYSLGVDDHAYRLLMAETAQRILPVALLEDAGEPLNFPTNSRCRLVTLAVGPECARRAGMYMLGLGHRRIAYVSHVNDTIWSRNREQGLRAAVADSGLSGMIVPVTSEHFTELVIDERAGARIEIEAFGRATAPIREGTGGDAQIARQVLAALGRHTTEFLSARANRRVMHPLFERALRTDATAWVCVNDAAALDAIAFLRTAGRRIPQDISVVGFDDSVEAFEARLTSYNFNLSGAVGMMISHVTNPSRTAVLHGRDGAIEVPGFVTPRMTTARV